jgi:alanine racemase
VQQVPITTDALQHSGKHNTRIEDQTGNHPLRPVRAVFDRRALAHNLSRARQMAPDARVMAILKANAYGHGLLESATALDDADAFGMLDLADAARLRSEGISKRICLLEGLFRDDDPDVLTKYDLEPVIHSHWQIEQLERIKGAAQVNVWLKMDTGMGRLGFPRDEVDTAYRRLSGMPQVKAVTLMSHLSDADDPDNSKTLTQLSRLRLSDADEVPRSLANSAAICGWPDTHLDWVRPGIMLYGSSPLQQQDAAQLDLKAVMSLQSEIIAVKSFQRGDTVGYGSTWVCPEAMRVGIIGCGYGDGYPRHAEQGTPVFIDGRLAKLVGRVSMDMITVDLRGHDAADVGSRAEMWGAALPVDEIARQAGTISYELMCGITARVARVEV